MRTWRSRTRKINQKFAWYKLRIGRSRIHCTGVFALEDIPAGKRVIEYTGKRLTLAEAFELKYPREIYLARLSREWILDGSIGGSGAELINHSCDPNLIWKRSRNHLLFYSKRRIRAGEELGYRYAYPVKITRVRCRCGSRKCRGTVRYLLR